MSGGGPVVSSGRSPFLPDATRRAVVVLPVDRVGIRRPNIWGKSMCAINTGDDTAGSLIAASKVNGTSVYDRAGEKLGTIYDIMINKASGRTAYAIMSFGGFLGVGNSYHPLPWQHLTYDEQQGGFVVDIDRSRMDGAPSYAEGDMTVWDDPAYGRHVDDYYARAAMI